MKRIPVIVSLIFLSATIFASCNNQSSADRKETTIKSTDGQADTTLQADEKYTCTMHQEVLSNHPGECPKCGMTLVKQKLTAGQEKMLKDGNYIKPKD
jgi:ssDNA-binding Zn-finger/Zn-ribbon topoisomerase 1